MKYIAAARPSNIDKKSKNNEESAFLCNYVDVYNNEFISSDLSFMKATANEEQIQKLIIANHLLKKEKKNASARR